MKLPSIPRGATIGIDSMCFIYQFETHAQYGPLVQSLFASIAEGKIHAVTSIVTVTETLATSNIAEIPDLRALYIAKLTQMTHLRLIPIDLFIAERAAMVRSHYKIKLGDALQVATALIHNASLFITNDKKLKRIPSPRVLLLDKLLE